MPRINHSRRNISYGFGNPLQIGAPLPIVAQRDPTTADIADLATTWVNPLSDGVWVLTSVVGNVATWTTSPASGVGIFTDVTITGGAGLDVLTIDDGNMVVSNGDITLSGLLTAGTATITGLTTLDDVDINGDVTITGDFDLTDTGSISLTSTNDAAGAITLTANGGTSETILITSLQGTSAASLNLVSAAGGLTATIAGLVSINSARNNAQAILLNASAGGIDILAAGAAGEDIDIVNTGGSVNITATEDAAQAVYIRANGGTSETVQIHADQGTGAASVNILSDVGGVTISGGLASADAINIVSSNAGGGIDIDSGTAGIAIDSTGAFSIDGAAASNITTTGAGIDLTLSSVLGSVLVSSTEDAALAIYLHANGGTSETVDIHSDQGTGVASINVHSDVGGVTVASGLASADAINITASNAAGGIDIDSGTAGFIVDTTGAVSLDSAAASNLTVTGAFDLTLASSLGSVNVTAGEAAADAIVLNASNAAGGIDLLTGGGEISISSGGNVAMVAVAVTEASPSATAIINARVGAATFTGFTTAAAGAQVFTITNSVVSATSQILVSPANEGANDAQMTITRINRGAGTFDVTLTNNGAAALNGNVTISFWVWN